METIETLTARIEENEYLLEEAKTFMTHRLLQSFLVERIKELRDSLDAITTSEINTGGLPLPNDYIDTQNIRIIS